MHSEAVMAKKKPNFEDQNPLVEVDLRTDEGLRTIKIGGLLPEESQD